MKEFSCGDVVPGCTDSFVGDSDDDIVLQAVRHAEIDHGIGSITEDLIAAVRSAIRTAEPSYLFP